MYSSALNLILLPCSAGSIPITMKNRCRTRDDPPRGPRHTDAAVGESAGALVVVQVGINRGK